MRLWLVWTYAAGEGVLLVICLSRALLQRCVALSQHIGGEAFQKKQKRLLYEVVTRFIAPNTTGFLCG
jgi:hypothetical protein